MAAIQCKRLAGSLDCCAATGVALMVVVICASAAIRLGQAAAVPLEAGTLSALRALHRTAAVLEVLAALWLGWLAWRARPEQPGLLTSAALALALTVALSALGIAAGRTPPPAAALGNVLGGLALGAVFAWIAGRSRGAPGEDRLARLGAGLLAAQCLLGASLSTLPGTWVSAAIPSHGILGLLLGAFVFRLAQRAASPARRAMGFALACLVPIAGFSVLHFERSAAAGFLHAAAAALLVIAAAYSRFRAA